MCVCVCVCVCVYVSLGTDNLEILKLINVVLHIIILLGTEQCTSHPSHSQQFTVYLHTTCAPIIPLPVILEISGKNYCRFFNLYNVIAHAQFCKLA